MKLKPILGCVLLSVSEPRPAIDVYRECEHLGTLIYDPEAWAHGRWFIEGEEVTWAPSRDGRTNKPEGYKTKTAAIRQLLTREFAE